MLVPLKRFTAIHAKTNFLEYWFLYKFTNILCGYNGLHMECVLSTILLSLLADSYISSTITARNGENKEGARGD